MTELLRTEALAKEFRSPEGVVRAVGGVDLHVGEGEIVGLVGESGSGKSTLGRLVLRLLEPTDGHIWFRDQELTGLDAKAMRSYRRSMQMVFQDPYASLNRKMTVRQILEEPLRVHGIAWNTSRLAALLERVGMPEAALQGYPHAFSGGQRQRIGIARALAVEPEFLVADEPVSSLDVSVQAQVLNLLGDLRAELGLAMLFIAHDLAVIRHIADRVVVMYLGRVVEEAPVSRLFSEPRHPYTQALLSAVPVPHPAASARGARIVLSGDIPSPVDVPSGCAFRTRCPLVEKRCAEATPPLEEVSAGHRRACWVT